LSVFDAGFFVALNICNYKADAISGNKIKTIRIQTNNPACPAVDESWKPILKEAFEKNIENWVEYKKALILNRIDYVLARLSL